MQELFDRLQKAVGEMANPSAEPAESEPATVEMSMEEFVGYVTEQVEKSANDTPEIKAERLGHLQSQIEVAKNFEGSPGGKVKVQSFKDRAQSTTTSKNVSAGNATPGSNFSAGSPTAPAGKPSTPSGGTVPPTTASGSGFATPAAATFAKSMEDLQKAIKAIGNEPTVPEAPATPAKVEKSESADPLWPMDMNTAFGRGETEADQVPEWGMDTVQTPAE